MYVDLYMKNDIKTTYLMDVNSKSMNVDITRNNNVVVHNRQQQN